MNKSNYSSQSNIANTANTSAERQAALPGPTENILDIPESLGELEAQGQSTDAMVVKLKETHMVQQNELVKDLKLMSEESKKIIDEINVIEADLEKYQVQIDGWIKNVSEMEAFVSKVRGARGPLEKKCKNMTKLKEFLGGDKAKRR